MPFIIEEVTSSHLLTFNFKIFPENWKRHRINKFLIQWKYKRMKDLTEKKKKNKKL